MKKSITVFKNKLFNLEDKESNKKYETLMTKSMLVKPSITILTHERIMKSLKMTDEDGIDTTIQQVWMMVSYQEIVEIERVPRPSSPTF